MASPQRTEGTIADFAASKEKGLLTSPLLTSALDETQHQTKKGWHSEKVVWSPFLLHLFKRVTQALIMYGFAGSSECGNDCCELDLQHLECACQKDTWRWSRPNHICIHQVITLWEYAFNE